MSGKRILFCSPAPVRASLGAAKVYIEAAEAFRRIGWQTELIGPETVGSSFHTIGYTTALRRYLIDNAAQFDVVDYEHQYLPFPRSDFPAGTLMVARSVLLAHAVYEAKLPPVPTWRGRLSHLLKGRARHRRQYEWVERSNRTLESADLVNLCNEDDRQTLIRWGHDANKIIVEPFGLFPERLAQFEPPAEQWADPPIVAFVGTFDPRKGMVEFPRFAALLARQRPIGFRLLGTAGLLRTADQVASFFPGWIRDRVEIVPHYDPANLPRLLADCALGVFPSRCEGFPFGVLEMQAAGLPVVAYRAPGPPMMLPADCLVTCGDWRTLAGRVLELLADPISLKEHRREARDRAASFRWEEIARLTAETYLQRLEGKRRS